MTYNKIIDAWFDYPWISYGIPILIFVLMVFFRDKLSKGKEHTWLILNAYYAIPVLMIFTVAIFNPMFFGYGSPVGVEGLMFEKSELFVLDYIGTAGSRYAAGEPCYRIHVLDSETGHKKIRFRVGYDAKIIGVSRDTLAIAHYGDVGYYSTSTGKLLVTYSQETLPNLFPQLSSGVDRIMWADGKNIMEISSLDGKEWKLYTKTRRLFPVGSSNENESYKPTNQLFIQDDEILIDDQRFGSDFIKLSGKDKAPNLKYIFNGRDSLLNHQLSFLAGRPVVLDSKQSSFVILHFETMKKEKCVLTSMSFTGQQKYWELKQSELYPSFTFRSEEDGPRVASDLESGKIFFNLGRNAFAVNLDNGNILWRQEL